jgi:hypothetical protein
LSARGSACNDGSNSLSVNFGTLTGMRQATTIRLDDATGQPPGNASTSNRLVQASVATAAPTVIINTGTVKSIRSRVDDPNPKCVPIWLS